MKLRYFPNTDTLYINLKERPSPESEEIAPEVIVDFDSDGDVVGITIDQASNKLDSLSLETFFPTSANL
jgi:uncharacterized protein YuzE